jgi:hypothetical protein
MRNPDSVKHYGWFGSLLFRIGILSRQAFDNGVGYFLLGMLCIIIALVALRTGQWSYVRFSHELDRQLGYLGAETEPQRTGRFGGVGALLLGSLSAGGFASSPEQQDAAASLRGVRSFATDIMVEVARARPPGSTALPAGVDARVEAERIVAEVMRCHSVAATVLSTDGNRWHEYVVGVVAEVLADTSPDSMEPGRAPASHESVLLDPRARRTIPGGGSGGQNCADPVLAYHPGADSRRYSRLLDVAVAVLEAGSGRESSQLSACGAMYYIGADNRLRYWHADGLSSKVVAELPPARAWLATPFMEQMHDDAEKESYRSLAVQPLGIT